LPTLRREEVTKRLLTDKRVSKDPRQHWGAWRRGEITPDWPLYSWVAIRSMFNAYGADHQRLRSLISRAFTVRRTAVLRPDIERITAELLESIAATSVGDVVDLREEFACPLPAEVISSLFGVPHDMRAALRRTLDEGNRTSKTPEEALANWQEMCALLNNLIAIKRDTPGDDLTTDLIAARDGAGSRLDETELMNTLLLMIGAGQETTINLLDHAITAMLTNPHWLDYARKHDGWDSVIEETLRWQAPVANLVLRYATEDIDLGGVTILQGEAILISYAAAGRDPEHYGTDADVFDPTRSDKDHLAFGHGAHHCVGAPLARLEAQIALPALFARFPNLILAGPIGQLVPLASFISNGHRTLPAIPYPTDDSH
jgi:2-hydroxy-5-methyl-1-naphthoate 7-hydroxylase